MNSKVYNNKQRPYEANDNGARFVGVDECVLLPCGSLGYLVTIRYSKNYSIQLYTWQIHFILQFRLNIYSCLETVAKLMKFLLKDWLLLIANKTSVPVLFERTGRIFDSPCETAFLHHECQCSMVLGFHFTVMATTQNE